MQPEKETGLGSKQTLRKPPEERAERCVRIITAGDLRSPASRLCLVTSLRERWVARFLPVRRAGV